MANKVPKNPMNGQSPEPLTKQAYNSFKSGNINCRGSTHYAGLMECASVMVRYDTKRVYCCLTLQVCLNPFPMRHQYWMEVNGLLPSRRSLPFRDGVQAEGFGALGRRLRCDPDGLDEVLGSHGHFVLPDGAIR